VNILQLVSIVEQISEITVILSFVKRSSRRPGQRASAAAAAMPCYTERPEWYRQCPRPELSRAASEADNGEGAMPASSTRAGPRANAMNSSTWCCFPLPLRQRQPIGNSTFLISHFLSCPIGDALYVLIYVRAS
jgi:hypothetical protein